jgi:hypothetical protein
MEASKVKVCILNASNGTGWYPVGSHRLKRSLIHHGYAHDFLFYNSWPNNEFDKMCPYNIKAAAFHEALKKDYDIILWIDCSIWAVDYPYSVLDQINHDGYYFWRSGYNCAQTCSDACLDYFGVNRDTAETYPEIATGLFGIHTGNGDAVSFITQWLKSARDGQFKGSREHDGQSSDPRFLFHRQDQSCASIIINKLGLKVHNYGEHIRYYRDEHHNDEHHTGDSATPHKPVFMIRGL